MRSATTLTCALVLGLGLADGAWADSGEVQRLGLLRKVKLRLGLRHALWRAHVNAPERRSQLTGRNDGGAPGMRGMLGRVGSMALDRDLWRRARYVRRAGQDGQTTLHLLDGQRQEIGRIDVARSPAGDRQLVDRVEVVNRLASTRGSYRAQADPRGELEVSAELVGQGPRIQRTERSILRGLHWAGPTYRMGFGWLTVGDGQRTGYRHRDGKRSMEWPAPAVRSGP